ncbi:MAG: MerR family transcriptional regulator [Firmicutes bacterium]|nr:MerR family transcriptional regulator [Bacillota bacterium]
MRWSVKQTSEKTGIPADTLRYYEKAGIVSPGRHENGYRYYDDNDILNLKYIAVMKYARFSLFEIKKMVEQFGKEASDGCNAVCKGILNTKIAELRQAVHNYQKIIHLMEDLMPMIDSIDAYVESEARIDGFISQIFEDVRKG